MATPNFTDPAGNNLEWLHAEIAAGKTTATVISSSHCCYGGITITSVGLGSPSVYDATSVAGNPIQVVPVSAPLGLVPGTPDRGIDMAIGLTISGGSTNPAMTIYWKAAT